MATRLNRLKTAPRANHRASKACCGFIGSPPQPGKWFGARFAPLGCRPAGCGRSPSRSPHGLQRLLPRGVERPEAVEPADLKDLPLVVRDVAERHAPVAAPGQLVQPHE